LSTREFRDRLRRRAKRAGIDLAPELAASLERYYVLLAKWNVKINLTSRLEAGSPDEALDRLLIEPLVAARHVATAATSIIDIGSGGGSPAIPLALAVPRLHLRMVESKTRKAVFLREAVRALDMQQRAIVETSRFEELLTRPELHEGLDLVTIRAVRVEPRTLVSLQAFLKPGGQLFLFRGPGRSDVADVVTPPLSWMATYPLVESLRSRLIVLQKNSIGRS
jgi:16S rRNA (guanine527-N7)-methyltransferase